MSFYKKLKLDVGYARLLTTQMSKQADLTSNLNQIDLTTNIQLNILRKYIIDWIHFDRTITRLSRIWWVLICRVPLIMQGFPGVSHGQLLNADIVPLSPQTFTNICCLIEALLITDICFQLV